MDPTDDESCASRWGTELDEVARTAGMSGVVWVDVAGRRVFARAYGLANRAHRVPNTVDTRFGMASGSKIFTALAVMSLIEEGVLTLDTRVRTLLSDDLRSIDDRVTIGQLLGHTSGIGDYIDENSDFDVYEHVLTHPVHLLDNTEAFVAEIDGYPQKGEPGAGFAYNNGGYIVLAVVAERAAGVGFHDLVDARVLAPAGLTATGYLRMDELPGDAAIGYLTEDSDRTNVLHLPVRGNGDGGAFTTVAELSQFWRAFADGLIVDPTTVREMTAPRSDVPEEGLRYGLGVWLDADGPGWVLDGMDAGATLRSRFDPATRTTVTVVSNTTLGALPAVRRLNQLVSG